MADEQPRPKDFGDYQRQLAAMMAEEVARSRDRLERLRRLAEREKQIAPAFGIEPAAERLAEMARIQRDGLELMQQIAAAQAIAYDEMIAAGGPDNPEAYERYCQATERHTALLPKFDAGG